MRGPLESSRGHALGCRLVEATGKPREANWFRQNLAIAIQRSNAFSILSACRERTRGLEGRGIRAPSNASLCSSENSFFRERIYYACFNFEVFNHQFL